MSSINDHPDSNLMNSSSSSSRALNSGDMATSSLAILRCCDPKPEYTNTGPVVAGLSATAMPGPFLPSATKRSRFTASVTVPASTTALERPWLRRARERATVIKSSSLRPSRKSAMSAAACRRRDGSNPLTGNSTCVPSASCGSTGWGFVS